MRELAKDEVQLVAGGFGSAHIDGGGNDDLFRTQTVTVTGGPGANAFYSIRATQSWLLQNGADAGLTEDELARLRADWADADNINTCEGLSDLYDDAAAALGAASFAAFLASDQEPAGVAAGAMALGATLVAGYYAWLDENGWCEPTP